MERDDYLRKKEVEEGRGRGDGSSPLLLEAFIRVGRRPFFQRLSDWKRELHCFFLCSLVHMSHEVI